MLYQWRSADRAGTPNRQIIMGHSPMTATEHPFDTATRVARREDGWSAHADTRYRAFVGTFGGVTAATLLNVLEREAAFDGLEIVALTTQFCAPLAEGEYRIVPALQRANRSTAFWRAEAIQGAEVIATASAVFGKRPETWAAQPAVAPVIPPYDGLPLYAPANPIPWTCQYAFRFAHGAPPSATGGTPDGSTASLLWMHDAPERALDTLSIAALSDAFFGRVFHAVGKIVPFGTVTMATYFHATSGELEASGDTRVIGSVRSNRLHAGFQDQIGELWSPQGRLLASCHQLAYYRC
jgi:hypothetical protein